MSRKSYMVEVESFPADLSEMSLLELSKFYSQRNRRIFGDVRERMRSEQERELEMSRQRIRNCIRGITQDIPSEEMDITFPKPLQSVRLPPIDLSQVKKLPSITQHDFPHHCSLKTGSKDELKESFDETDIEEESVSNAELIIKSNSLESPSSDDIETYQETAVQSEQEYGGSGRVNANEMTLASYPMKSICETKQTVQDEHHEEKLLNWKCLADRDGIKSFQIIVIQSQEEEEEESRVNEQEMTLADCAVNYSVSNSALHNNEHDGESSLNDKVLAVEDGLQSTQESINKQQNQTRLRPKRRTQLRQPKENDAEQRKRNGGIERSHELETRVSPCPGQIHHERHCCKKEELSAVQCHKNFGRRRNGVRFAHSSNSDQREHEMTKLRVMDKRFGRERNCIEKIQSSH